MSLANQLQALQKLTNAKQQNVKEATIAFKKFQLELIRNGHKLNKPQDLKAASYFKSLYLSMHPCTHY